MTQDLNRAPAVYPAKRHPPGGYVVRFAWFDATGQRRRGRAYGRTASEADQDAKDRWWRAVGEVREQLAGRRVESVPAAAPVTWAALVERAAPTLHLGQKARQVLLTVHYAATVWAGFCMACGALDRTAVEAVGERLKVVRDRCKCGGRFMVGAALSEITPAVCAGVLAAARGVMKDASVNRVRSAGAVLFQHAVDARLIDAAPTDRVRRLKEARRVPALMTGEQALAFADALTPRPRPGRWSAPVDWRPFVLAMLCAGLRLGEVQHLRVGDVELHRLRIVVRLGSDGAAPKSGHERIVPIVSSRLADALGRAVAGRASAELVAPHTEPRGAIERAAKAAGVAKAPTRHGLRHLFCSAALAGGVPLPTVRGWLGHSDVGVTDRYAHAVQWCPGFAELFDGIGQYTTKGGE